MLLARCRCWGVAGCSAVADIRWFKGQNHYSGTYWCATDQGHVIYESRLELARLLFADFDRRVKHIVAQPFLLRTKVGGPCSVIKLRS